MTVNQLRALALRMGACAELFIRARLKRQELPEETEWVNGLLRDRTPTPDDDQEWLRQESRRLFWEASLGMANDWPKEVPDCPKQGFSNGV